MRRRDFLSSIAGMVGTLSLPGRLLRGAERASSKPNIVLILADDLGWADLGCYGNPFNESPNIDRLASQGVRFTDAYAASPVCSPTRASILAGQYPARVGILDFITGLWRPYAKLQVPINRTQYLPLDTVTIAEALKPAGYTCGAFGKWHLGVPIIKSVFDRPTGWPAKVPPSGPVKYGFDDWRVQIGSHFGSVLLGPNGPQSLRKDESLAETLTGHAERFMAANADRPFFLYLPYHLVHLPLQAKQETIEKYLRKEKPESGVNNPIYGAMVEELDQSVGRVLAKIDGLGLAENTLVIFFSDNGGLRQNYRGTGPIVTSNAPLRDEKGTLYEGGIRVPLVVRWQGVFEPGGICDEPVTSVDFYPTLLAATAVQGDSDYVLDGEDILPLLRGDGRPTRDAIYWHYPMYQHSTPAGAIRAGAWKLIEFFEDGHLELYNLAEDIGEKNNLVARNPGKAAELREKLAAWRRSVNAVMPVENPDYDPRRAEEWGQHPSRLGNRSGAQ